MTTYHAPAAAVAAFLALVCIEGAAVFIWRWLGDGHLVPVPPMDKGEWRRLSRRDLFSWLALALLMEASHDLMRSAYYAWPLETWPHAASFWLTLFEAVAVLGLIRTFTRRVCGEWGWTLAAILPLAVALGVLVR